MRLLICRFGYYFPFSNITLYVLSPFLNTRDPVSLGSSLLCLGQDLGKMFLQRGWPLRTPNYV
jgi:hypothetical protein